MIRNDQNKRGKYLWFQSNFSRGKTFELVVMQLLSIKGLFCFIILLYFTLASSLALSLRLNEPIYDYINTVTNFILSVL